MGYKLEVGSQEGMTHEHRDSQPERILELHANTLSEVILWLLKG